MALGNRQATAPVDKNSPEFAVQKFNTARSNLLLAVIFTAVNILLGLAKADVYFLFSITFPYYMMLDGFLVPLLLGLLVLAAYLCGYLFSKKNPGLMIVMLVAFSLDCLFLVGISVLAVLGSAGEVGFGSFIIDYLAHIWVLVYLIIGVRYLKRYKAAMAIESPAPEVPAAWPNAQGQPLETAAAVETAAVMQEPFAPVQEAPVVTEEPPVPEEEPEQNS